MSGLMRLIFLTGLLMALTGCQPGGPAVESYPPAVEERVALVIGNAAYRNFTRLDGAERDADLVADALRKQGFTLVGGGALHNLNWAQTVQYMRVFEARMDTGGVAVFYHSGHVAQVNGENFLIPVDAADWAPGTVDTELVRLAGSFRPPAGREPRIKLVILDRTLPGPLLEGPTPVMAISLADEILDQNEMQIFAASEGSRTPQADEILDGPDGADTVEPEVSALARAFADTLRTPYSDVIRVAYQASVIVAEDTDDRQHLSIRFGSDIERAGPLVGTLGSNRLLSRLDEAERSILTREASRREATRASLSSLVGSETRSVRAVSDTVATLTVLNIDDTFPSSRSGRTLLVDDDLQVARLEAWRRVLEQSRASTLDDWQKAAILSVTSSTSSNRLHAAGIDQALESGEFAELPDAIERLAVAPSGPIQDTLSVRRRRVIERALFELPTRGHGAGAIIAAFPQTGVDADLEPGVHLDTTLNRARSAVADCSPAPLNANQMEALASFAVSISVETFSRSAICRRLGDNNVYAVARELAFSSFRTEAGRIAHDEQLLRRRAYETALFLAVTQGAARDRLHEVRLARTLEEQGIDVAPDASEADLVAATRPQAEAVAAPSVEVAQAFSAASGMRNAAYFIRMFEGLELDAYQDIVGVWTIGFGTTGPDIGPGQHITADQAMRYLEDYVETDWRGLEPSVETELSPNQQAAILSLSYNVGRNRVAESTLLNVLNEGNLADAADQFLAWNQARINGELTVIRGLDRRRHAERALFSLSPDADIAESVIIANIPLMTERVEIDADRGMIGYGSVMPLSGTPNRMDEAAARDQLRADLANVRAQITNQLARPLEPLQIEALTILAYTMGERRFRRTPVMTYINQGNTQAALAAIGYWDDGQIGAAGQALTNWGELRASAAALFTMGFRS